MYICRYKYLIRQYYSIMDNLEDYKSAFDFRLSGHDM